MATNIGELVSDQTENGSTVATASDTETTIQLEQLEKDILITAANPYYEGSYLSRVMSVHSLNDWGYKKFKRSIRKKLNISDQNLFFTALCIALKNGLVTIDDILGGKDIAKELPKFKVLLRRLSRGNKENLVNIYDYTLEHHGGTYSEISDISEYTGVFKGTNILGVDNHAQLPFFAHIYAHFIHNRVEELFDEKELDALEALVVKTNRKGVYNFNSGTMEKKSIYNALWRVRKKWGIRTSMEAVLKALELGFYTLLHEVSISDFIALNDGYIDLLKTIHDSPDAISKHQKRTDQIYKELGIHTRTQLAPYIFLARNLEEHEMDAIRSAHASPDQDPMQIIYEKFDMPEHSALLAPSKYFATKREMAAK